MSRPFLFGGSSQATQSKYLVEFKAGKMNMDGSTVTPINKKGTVFLHQTEDQLIHFCWKDRTSGQTEDDWIIFPDDAEFKRVSQCTTGRVFVLKFKTNPRRIFFWMQEPNDDKDDEYCQKINDFINNPPPPGSSIRGSAGERGGSGGSSLGGSLGEIGSINETDLQNLFNNVSPQQLMQMIGGVGGLPSGGLASLLGAHTSSGGASGRSRASGGSSSGLTTSGNSSSGQGASTTSTGSNNQAPRTSSSVSGSVAPIQLGDLRNIISNLNVPSEASNSTSSGPQVDLSTSINYDALKPLLSNESFMSHVKEYLPPRLDESGQAVPVDSTRVSEQLAATVSSPQFQQALSLFSAALQSGQLGPLIAQFNLGDECVTAANNGDLESFVRALEKNAKQSTTTGTSQESSSEDKKSDDMALD